MEGEEVPVLRGSECRTGKASTGSGLKQLGMGGGGGRSWGVEGGNQAVERLAHYPLELIPISNGEPRKPEE